MDNELITMLKLFLISKLMNSIRVEMAVCEKFQTFIFFSPESDFSIGKLQFW